METYPSIERVIIDKPIYAFDKIDGSNIRAEWNRKTGFTKFGTRKQLMDKSTPVFGEAVELIEEKYVGVLSEIFKKERLQRATAFFEFYGPNSFAGQHVDETHDVMLFDLHIYKQGVIPPKEFLKMFKHVETAPLLYTGKPNQQFLDSVRNGTLEGITFEGVVCKGDLNNRRQVEMFKVKNLAWLEKLKERYGDNPALYQKLM